MGLELLNRWSPDGLLLESPTEDDLARILEGGPGTNGRAVFALTAGWREALEAVAAEPTAIARSRLVIFPQVSVSQYRVDFMVVCADVADVRRATSLSRFAFFVECDGRVGHAENGEQLLADYKRELEIRRQTGLTVLRFSGAEVMYQPTEVDALIGAQVEALAALREYGDAVDRIANAVLEAVARLSCHRALRIDYTVRNSQRSQAEPYDPYDSLGEYEFSKDLEREAEWDSFLDLRMKVARLRHAVADAHRTIPDYRDSDKLSGGPQPFAEALAAALATLTLNIELPRPD